MNKYAILPCLALLGGCSIGQGDVSSENASSGDDAVGHARQAVTACVTPSSNLIVRTSTTLCPGSYNIGDPEGDGVIQIRANNVELTISGVTLTGTGTGYGITAIGVNGATIKSAPANRGRIRSFRAAILIEGGASHRVLENVLSSNIKRPITGTPDDFLQVWPEWEDQIALGQVGDGLVLRNVASATVTNNQARLQQNGISLFGSSNVTMRGNDCSDNQGWGIQLHGSSNNNVIANRADNVNLAASVYCHNDQADACDTAGILVIKGANDNLLQDNSFQNGGDGIFSAALGPPGDTLYGADRNRYIHNDVSRAKHLGIEATFADGLVVENNTVANVGRSGVWLGGSTNSIIRGNTITGSGWSGIENEGTRNITIENNRISGSGQNGIFLREIRASVFRASTSQFIARNTIQNNLEFGIRAVDTSAMNATGNTLGGNGFGDVHLELDNETSLAGLAINESRLLDATTACHGVDVTCGCRVLSGNAAACSATPGCTYFACSSRCEPAGTTACDAGCPGACTGSCSDHDGSVRACDAVGCAYYFCSQSCRTPGTPIEEACPCEPHGGDPAGCSATPGCSFYPCSGGCFFTGTAPCLAGCLDACGTGPIDCPITGDATSNYWGTSDPNVIDAAICGASLSFVPFKTSP